MTKVDQVLINRLKKLAHIDLDAEEMNRLCQEISQAVIFIGQLDDSPEQDPHSPHRQGVRINQLREDKPEKPRFAFFENVPEQEDGYVVF